MVAIGAGGLDVAVAMGGGEFYLTCPRAYQVNLTGSLRPWISAKDVALKMLELLGVKGNVGVVIEYAGPGVATLSVPERATITNMGAEMGVDHLGVPVGRGDPRLPGGPGPLRMTGRRWRLTPTPSTTALSTST